MNNLSKVCKVAVLVLLFLSFFLSTSAFSYTAVPKGNIARIFDLYAPTLGDADITALGTQETATATLSWWGSYPIQIVFSNSELMNFTRQQLDRGGNPTGVTHTMVPVVSGAATGLDVDVPAMPGSTKEDLVTWQPKFGAGDGQVTLGFGLTATTDNDGGEYAATITYSFVDIDYP